MHDGVHNLFFLFLFSCSESPNVLFFSFFILEIVMKVPFVFKFGFYDWYFFFCFHFIFNWILYILCFIKWGCVPEPLRLVLSNMEISVNFSQVLVFDGAAVQWRLLCSGTDE